jgi:hypothetical protein
MAIKIRYHIFKVALITVIGIIAVFLAFGAVDAQETQAAKSEDASQEKVEPVPGLADLIRKASSLKTRLRELEKGLTKAYDFSDFEEKLTGLQNEIEGLKTDLEKIENSESYSYDHLVELKRSIRLKMASIDKMIQPVTDAIRKIELWQKEWTHTARQWEKWEKTYQEELSLNTVQTVFQRSQEIFLNARSIIMEQLEPLLSAEHRLEEIRSQAEIVLADVDALILAMRGGAAQSDTASMFSLDYYRQFDAGLVLDLLKNVRILSWPEREYFVREWWVMVLQLVVILAIAIGIQRHQAKLEQNRRSQFLAKRPWAAGIFVSIALLHTLHGQLPQIWGLFLWALIAFAVVRLLEGYIKDALSPRSSFSSICPCRYCGCTSWGYPWLGASFRSGMR